MAYASFLKTRVVELTKSRLVVLSEKHTEASNKFEASRKRLYDDLKTQINSSPKHPGFWAELFSTEGWRSYRTAIIEYINQDPFDAHRGIEFMNQRNGYKIQIEACNKIISLAEKSEGETILLSHQEALDFLT